jgi:hypothetical protein
MKCAPLLCLSVTANMELNPLLSGSPTTMLADKSFHGSVGIGFNINFPAGCSYTSLVQLQTSQSLMYSIMYFIIPGHQ